MNATKIQQPINFFPVPSKQLLHSLVFRLATNLASTEGEQAPFGELHIFYEVLRNSLKSRRPACCWLHAFSPSFCHAAHEVLLNRAKGVLRLEGRSGLR